MLQLFCVVWLVWPVLILTQELTHLNLHQLGNVHISNVIEFI